MSKVGLGHKPFACPWGLTNLILQVWGIVGTLGSNLKFDTVAEWLRRLTRNQLGLSRAGSSPVSVGLPIILTFSSCLSFFKLVANKEDKLVLLPSSAKFLVDTIYPAISWLRS